MDSNIRDKLKNNEEKKNEVKNMNEKPKLFENSLEIKFDTKNIFIHKLFDDKIKNIKDNKNFILIDSYMYSKGPISPGLEAQIEKNIKIQDHGKIDFSKFLINLITRDMNTIQLQNKIFNPSFFLKKHFINESSFDLCSGFDLFVRKKENKYFLDVSLEFFAISSQSLHDMINIFQIYPKMRLKDKFVFCKLKTETYEVEDLKSNSLEIDDNFKFRNSKQLHIKPKGRELLLNLENCFLVITSRENQDLKKMTLEKPMGNKSLFPSNLETELQTWGVSIKFDFNDRFYEKLEDPQIIFNDNKVVDTSFNSTARSSKTLDPINLERWILFYVKNNFYDAECFLDRFNEQANIMNIKVESPQFIVFGDFNEISRIKFKKLEDIQLVVLMITRKRVDLYKKFKFMFCVETPIPSQVITNCVMVKDKKVGSSLYCNIANQINCKLGGRPWYVENSKMKWKNWMVVGVDVNPIPNPKTERKEFVFAFVSSLDSIYTKWHSKTKFLDESHFMKELDKFLIGGAQAYLEEQKFLPNTIIVYINEMEKEDFDFESFSSEFLKYFNPKVLGNIQLIMVIVKKRMKRYFFSTDKENIRSPNPGTIVYDVENDSNCFDFFLVSQNSKFRLVAPTYYKVISNSHENCKEIVKQLTYNLTFIYFNWTGTVKYPAPCIYAYKLRRLTGEILGCSANENLNNKLFYL